MPATTRRQALSQTQEHKPANGADHGHTSNKQQLRNPNAPPRTSLSPPLLVPIIFILILTSLIGSTISLRLNSQLVTNLRSRLPLSQLSDAATREALHPGPIPYFAHKGNFFNQFFVKKGWAWTTALVFLHSFTAYFFGPTLSRESIVITPASNRAALLLRQVQRYLIATAYWWLLTQGTWFFGAGPSLAQRVLLATGAECIPASNGDVEACIGTKGAHYAGGHDVSGHTFLLVLSILLLWETASSTLIADSPFLRRLSNTPASSVPSKPATLTAYASLALMGLWWWMLAMTSVYFHTPQEKVSGFVFALAGWWLTQLVDLTRYLTQSQS